MPNVTVTNLHHKNIERELGSVYIRKIFTLIIIMVILINI